MTDPWEAQREALGAFIREQRKRANLSLRQLAELTSLSNPYLSQVERGLHQPSVRVLKALSGALNVSAETLMTQAGLIDVIAGEATGATDTEEPNVPGTEEAIRRRPAPRRGAEGRPDRRLPQHARLGAPRHDGRRTSRRHHVPQQQRRGHRPDPARHRAERPRHLRDRRVHVPGQPAVRRGVGPHVDHDRPTRHKAGPTSPARPAATTSTSAVDVTAARSTVREWHTVTVASRAISSCATGLPTTAERPTTTARRPLSATS